MFNDEAIARICARRCVKCNSEDEWERHLATAVEILDYLGFTTIPVDSDAPLCLVRSPE